MAKYLVDYYETYSKSYEIEANSKEEAEDEVRYGIQEGKLDPPENCTRSWCETEELEEFASLCDGVTTCCGFDFGIDADKAKYCPICGSQLIKITR